MLSRFRWSRRSYLVEVAMAIILLPARGTLAHPRSGGDRTSLSVAGSAGVQRSYNGTAEMVSNPERGFRMEVDNGCDGIGITDAQIALMKLYNLTVAQTYCYLPTNKTLAPATLTAVSRAFTKLRSAGVKALLRFAYDRDMPGTEVYTIATILGHIDQLADTVHTNADALYVLQAGFLGSWGEWHSSKAGLSDNASVTSALLEAELFTLLPADRKINVRVPSYKLAALRRRPTVDGDSPKALPCSPGNSPAVGRVTCPGCYGGINASSCVALGCCFNDTIAGVPFCFMGYGALPQPMAANYEDAMAFGVLDGGSSKDNTAVARIGFDNDGFMSTSNDGGTFGNQYTKSAWYVDPTSAKKVPFPDMTNTPINGSVSTPVYATAQRGPQNDPAFDYARRESAWVPMDGEMFWKAGSEVYDPTWPEAVTAEQAAFRLRAMHYSTLSLVHGFDQLDSGGVNETINRWMRTALDLPQILQARLPVSPAYAAAVHTGFEYVRDHLGFRLELRTATFPSILRVLPSVTTLSPSAGGPTVPFVFNASVVNWGFAAPINPRPLVLVLLTMNGSSVVWQSKVSLADVRDWQPYHPGDPTFTPLEYSFGGIVDGVEPTKIPGCVQTCTLSIGLMLPDSRMASAISPQTTAAFSVRFANEGVGWKTVAGVGAVNVLGNVTLQVQ